MSYEKLTDKEYATLNKDQQKFYDRAIDLADRENAGGPGGGWSDGYEMLRVLGWEYVVRDEGIRSFVSMKKPERFL